MRNNIALSIVLPVHNEAKAVGTLIREIEKVFETSLPKPGEIIIVDDASDDGSVEVVEAAVKDAASRNRLAGPTESIMVSPCILPERCGQSQALMNGLMTARAELIVSLDGDGQYDPADIPRLFENMREFDMLCGVRKHRKDTVFRGICSRFGNAFRNLVTDDCTTDAGCTFRVMRKSCLPALAHFQGTLFGIEFFFHPLILRKKGFRVGEMEVRHRPRISGKSKYSPIRGRLLRGLKACIKARRISSIFLF
jgi:dolichol-phosphate mannosyltransferase